jgi:hypothetical protein
MCQQQIFIKLRPGAILHPWPNNLDSACQYAPGCSPTSPPQISRVTLNVTLLYENIRQRSFSEPLPDKPNKAGGSYYSLPLPRGQQA